MQSHYIVNIARAAKVRPNEWPRHEHFAAVRLPHMKANEAKAIADTLEIAKRFPSSEGWKIELTYWEGIGHGVKLPPLELDC